MARNRRGGTMEDVVTEDNTVSGTLSEDVTPVEDLDVEAVADDETEEVAIDSTSATAKAAKPTGPTRGDLPEGYVTPVGLAHALTKEGLGGEGKVVPPQMVYSYMKSAPAAHPFPVESVKDSNGNERQAVKVDAGLQWWREKNERVAAKKANAAQKATAKAEKAKATDAETAPVAEAEAAATEAE
jgi:hypothetical protein